VGLSDTDANNLSDFQSVAQYYVQKRYSELLTFHKLVVAEMKSYLKKKNLPLTDFPEFPGKKLFFNKD